eukprot:1880909-Rhodomonas_salina.3
MELTPIIVIEIRSDSGDFQSHSDSKRQSTRVLVENPRGTQYASECRQPVFAFGDRFHVTARVSARDNQLRSRKPEHDRRTLRIKTLKRVRDRSMVMKSLLLPRPDLATVQQHWQCWRPGPIVPGHPVLVVVLVVGIPSSSTARLSVSSLEFVQVQVQGQATGRL